VVIDVHMGGPLYIARPEGITGTHTESLHPELTDHYQRQIEAFGRAIATNTPVNANGEDGLRAVEVAAAIITSQRTGRRVAVERSAP